MRVNFMDRGRPMVGVFAINVYHRGVLVGRSIEKNLIVDGAKDQLARLVGGDGAGRHITQIGFGTSAAPAEPSDNALQNAYIKALSGHSYPNVGTVQYDWTLSSTEANGLEITEFALICADNTLFSRKVRGAISKAADMSLDGSWTLIF